MTVGVIPTSMSPRGEPPYNAPSTMSTFRTDPPIECGGGHSSARIERFPAREATVGALELRRALPVRERRMVGPWCFLDRYGPLSFTDSKPMDVAPHPHIGLQTVSWLFEGEVLHRDSLGFESLIRPGELNLMTSGRAISHSEETPRINSGQLSGVQLWVALPDSERNRQPDFEHHTGLPELDLGGGRMMLFMGSAGGERSPATAHSQMIGADVRVDKGATVCVGIEPSFEHALLLTEGEAALDGERLLPDTLYYLGSGQSGIPLRSHGGARIILIGGAPFEEQIVMWWNFVARTHEEIATARADWESRERFGTVHGYDGPRLDAPPLKTRATPPPAS